MSSCFYDMRGGMVGLDKHTYWKMLKGVGWPGIVIGIPESKRHLVFSGHDWFHNENHTTTVTSDGNLMLKKDFSMEYIPHIPLVTDVPAVLEAVWLAGVIVRSKSEPIMYMPSVSGQGTSLACCLYEMIGANKNCSGHGIVINPNSVITSPSLKDFAKVLAGMIYNAIVDWIVEGAIGTYFPQIKLTDGKDGISVPNPVADLLKWTFDEYVKKNHIDPLVEPRLESFIDGL